MNNNYRKINNGKTEAEKAEMMIDLQQIGLTMDDIREYLDTHPYDAAAISRYNMAAVEYAALKDDYSAKFTPLNSDMPSNNDRMWAWGLSEFPWLQ